MTAAMKAQMQRVYDMVNSGDLSGVEEVIAPDIVEHEPVPGAPEGASGIELFKYFVTSFRTAFPDLKMEVEQMVADGDMLATRIRMSGTHQGPFLGMPPTGRSFSITAMDLVRFNNGRIVEHWGNGDDLGLIRQLGLRPPG